MSLGSKQADSHILVIELRRCRPISVRIAHWNIYLNWRIFRNSMVFLYELNYPLMTRFSSGITIACLN